MLERIDKASRLYIVRRGKPVTFEAAHMVAVAASSFLARPDLAPPPRLGTKRGFRSYTRAVQATREALGLRLDRRAVMRVDNH